jgi:hypothetical protein
MHGRQVSPGDPMILHGLRRPAWGHHGGITSVSGAFCYLCLRFGQYSSIVSAIVAYEQRRWPDGNTAGRKG